MRCTSDGPSPMRRIRASRNHRSSGISCETPSPPNRLTDAGQCSNPDPPPATYGAYTNPDDSGFQSFLVDNVWTTPEANFPTPYGIFEDHFSVTGDPACAGSYEYGTGPCNAAGHATSDWETALGDFEKVATNCGSACLDFIGNGLTPGGGNDTGPCIKINTGTGECWASPDAGIVNDMDALTNLCSSADSAGHLRGIAAEEIVFLKGKTINGQVSADPQTIVYMINTMSQLVTFTTGGCAHTVAIDVESSGGSFPGLGYKDGSVAAGIPIREEATALRFLVPNPATLVPDRMQPFYYQIAATVNAPTPSACTTVGPPPVPCEVPYFFEETMVPQGPEVPVAMFQWNGAKQSVGDGCPTPNPGDSGGAVSLMVACVTDPDTPTDGAAVFRQEYKHFYIDGNDYGPAAVLLNVAKETSVNINPTWFTCAGCDPITSFHSQFSLSPTSGGELQSVLYPGGTIAIPACTSSNCNGNNTVSGNTVPFYFNVEAPPTIGPDSGIILLGSGSMGDAHAMRRTAKRS